VASVLVLGRQAADLVIEDAQVSRRHASVRPAGDALEVEDLGSKNGTWVNGGRIAGAVRVASGDRVRVGDSTFQVELDPASASADERPAGAALTEPTPALPFEPPPQRPDPRPGVATRRLTPTVLAFGTVIVTAIALVLYFAMR
jgi:pSer/pThr/pTyr-binding forkhead associated (FHA) protein